MLAAAPLVGMLDFVLAIGMKSNPFDYQDGDFTPLVLSMFIFAIYGIMVGGSRKCESLSKRMRSINASDW